MPSIRPEDLTPFGRASVKLDQEFAELVKIGEQMKKEDLESDNGLDEGVKILNRAALAGQSLADTMQEFSNTLQEAREKAEAATALVAERAQVIKKRREQQNLLHDKLETLKEDVQKAGASLSSSAAPAKGPLGDDDKKRIAAELERMQAPMKGFIEAAQAIKAEAAAANFKRLERQADAMIDSMQSSLRKIAQAIAQS